MPADPGPALIAVAEDLAGEFSLHPLLERILRRCTELLGCHAGSICSVDEAGGTPSRPRRNRHPHLLSDPRRSPLARSAARPNAVNPGIHLAVAQ